MATDLLLLTPGLTESAGGLLGLGLAGLVLLWLWLKRRRSAPAPALAQVVDYTLEPQMEDVLRVANRLLLLAEFIEDHAHGTEDLDLREDASQLLAQARYLLVRLGRIADAQRLRAEDLHRSHVALAYLCRRVEHTVAPLLHGAGSMLELELPADLQPIETDAERVAGLLAVLMAGLARSPVADVWTLRVTQHETGTTLDCLGAGPIPQDGLLAQDLALGQRLAVALGGRLEAVATGFRLHLPGPPAGDPAPPSRETSRPA